MPTIRETMFTAIAEAAPIVLLEYGRKSNVSFKGDNFDYLTPGDMDAEDVIRHRVSTDFPDHRIIGEEKEVRNPDASPTWRFDPASGSVNLALGLHGVSTAISFEVDGIPQFSAVYDPVLEELFWADGNEEGAYRQNGFTADPERLNPTTTNMLDKAVIFAATKGVEDVRDQERFYREYWPKFINEIRTFRRMGSLALEQAYIAAGRIDAQVHFPSDKFAIPAGKHILEKVGGLITDFQGNPWTRESLTVLASNGQPGIHQGLVDILAPFTPLHTPVY